MFGDTWLVSLCGRRMASGSLARSGGEQQSSASSSSSSASPSSSMNDNMNSNEVHDAVEGFLNSGRTGRRNALSNVFDETYATASTAELPLELEKLSCSDQGAGPSGAGNPQTSTSAGAN